MCRLAVVSRATAIWHWQVIVGKFMRGFPTDDGVITPQVKVVSLCKHSHKPAQSLGPPQLDFRGMYTG